MSAGVVQRALQVLRGRGYKVTAARRAVLEALAEAEDHLTAPGVVAAVRHRAPEVGRASVYRTLELLTRLHVAQASSLGGPATTYLLAPGGHHHHVICTTCHRAVSFDDCGVSALEDELAARLGFEIEGHLVELYGRCPACQRES